MVNDSAGAHAHWVHNSVDQNSHRCFGKIAKEVEFDVTRFMSRIGSSSFDSCLAMNAKYYFTSIRGASLSK